MNTIYILTRFFWTRKSDTQIGGRPRSYVHNNHINRVFWDNVWKRWLRWIPLLPASTADGRAWVYTWQNCPMKCAIKLNVSQKEKKRAIYSFDKSGGKGLVSLDRYRPCRLLIIRKWIRRGKSKTWPLSPFIVFFKKNRRQRISSRFYIFYISFSPHAWCIVLPSSQYTL